MNTAFRKSFAKDLKKIKERKLLDQIQAVIEEVEKVDNPQQISGLKKLSGSDHCYRIRIGDYRMGIVIEEETVEFVRCLHRKDLYRFFP
jgi:mRNA interferase RelE/StbE